MDNMIKEKLALKQQIDSLEQNLSNQIKEKESLLQTFTVFKNESKEKESKYMDKEIDLEKKIKELDNIVYKVGQSAQTVHMLTKPQVFYDDTHKQALGYQNPVYPKKAHWIKPTLYDGSVISNQHVVIPVIDDEETLILEELSYKLKTLKEHIKSMQENDKEEKVKQDMDEIETINIELEHRMFKLDLDPLAPRLLKNWDTYIDYLKYTQEQADILLGIVEQAKAKQPLDNALEFACKHAKQIQELLVYVQDTCPTTNKPSKKLVVVRPMNKVKKVRFSETLTSSSNIHKQVESSKTPDSNTPVLPSTGLKSSTSASRSQPTGNKKNDKISQTPSINMKNKVEDHPRRVKSKSNKNNRVKDPICDANVKHTMLNANSELICVKCKQCMFDANHNVCFLDFVNDVNVRSKCSSKKAKIVQSKIANNSEPNHLWGSNATDVPSCSSLVNDRLSRLFSGIWTPDAQNI
ncbi:hypothetical protein Tco_0322635 [Tanacetum coccineum]